MFQKNATQQGGSLETLKLGKVCMYRGTLTGNRETLSFANQATQDYTFIKREAAILLLEANRLLKGDPNEA